MTTRWTPIKLFDGELGWVVERDNLCVAEQLNQSDARLIAAAPDLLAALKECVPHPKSTLTSEKLLSVIAEAEGRAE